MLRRLRTRTLRAPRTFVALALLAFAGSAMAGPLAYCLRGDDAPRVMAAASHCETMAKTPGGMHLPAVDQAVSAGVAGVAAPSPSQGLVLFAVLGGLLPSSLDPLPVHRDAYGGASDERSSMRSLAGAVAGHSVRLLI